MADHSFSNARTFPEIQKAHQTWWKNYNAEDHYGHRERQDGRHSPEAVLRGRLGRTFPEEVLARVPLRKLLNRGVVGAAVANGALEDGRIGGQAGDRVLFDVVGQSAGV